MVSYYNYLRGLGQFNGSLSELIRSEHFGVRNWVRHVENWYLHSSPSLAFMMVRYEDLKKDPASEIKRVYRHLGFTLPQLVLDNAVKLSSFSNMKALEVDLNYGGRPGMEGFQFLRRGQTGESLTKLSDSDSAYIINCAGHLMERMGYL